LALAGVTAAKIKMIAEHLITARIFTPKLRNRISVEVTTTLTGF
jgi:hypothetical protein